MKKFKTDSLIFGVLIIIAAVLLALSAVFPEALLPYNIKVWQIPATLIVLYALIKAVIKLKIEGIFFPIALLYSIFRKQIETLTGNEDLPSAWFALLIALLLTIGFGLVFHSFGRKKSVNIEYKSDNSGNKKNMGTSIKYIDCAKFTQEDFCDILGTLDVYFENTDAYTGGGVLNIGDIMGRVTVHLPADWRVTVNKTDIIGTVTEPAEEIISEKNLTANVCDVMGTVQFVR